MEEILVKKYKASDGKVFSTADKCIEYEKKLNTVAEIEETIAYIKEICSENICNECPFFGNKCRFGYSSKASAIMPCDW